MISIRETKYLIIILFLSSFFLTGCYQDDGGKIHKYDTTINTKTRNFELDATSSNVGKWIDTGISVKKDVAIPLNIKGNISLCGGNIINKKVGAIACDDFTDPIYPTYNENDIVKDFVLDPVIACPKTAAFSNTMQYTDTGINILKGDLISFSLEPKRIALNNCSNPPSSITLEDTLDARGNKISAAQFCNDYLSQIPAGSNIFQAYINNDFGPEGNKVMLRDDSPIVWLGEEEKEISYTFPHVYIDYFDNTDQILNFVVDSNYSLSSRINYQLNSKHKFQYYGDIYVASRSNPPNTYFYEYNGIENGLDSINKLIKNILYLSDILRSGNQELYNLVYSKYAMELAYFAHDYQKILTDRAKLSIAKDRDLYRRIYNHKLRDYTRFWPTATDHVMLKNSGQGSGADVVISRIKNIRKDVFNELSTQKNSDGLKFNQKYTKFVLDLPKTEISIIPRTLNHINNYRHRGKLTRFSNIFLVNKNTCHHNYDAVDVDLFLDHLKNDLRGKLDLLRKNGLDFENLYSWRNFEAKFRVLKTLREHEFFCYDASDGQSFDYASIMDTIKNAYLDFVSSLNSSEHAIDRSTVNNKSLNLYPFWLRSNLIDFRDLSRTHNTISCNLINNIKDSQKKFDVFTLNYQCENICTNAQKENCVYTVLPSKNVVNSVGSIKLFNNDYKYDQDGAYNIIADRLVAKIASDGDVTYDSIGHCIAKDKGGKCTDLQNTFADSIRLNKDYLVNEDGQVMLMISDDQFGYGKNYGGYNVNINHSCNFSNGDGVYYYTGDKLDVKNKKPQDVKAESLSTILDENGEGYLTPYNSGSLFVYIPERTGSTAAYSGDYNIQTTSENGNTPISDILMPIFNAFERNLYGVRNANGEYDHTKPGIVKRFYQGFITQSGFSKALQALLVLYLALTAFGYLTGILDAKNADILLRLIKMSIITILMSGSSWDFFNETLFALVKDGSTMLVEAIMTNSGSLTGNPFALYDRVGNIIFAEQTWERIGLMFGIFPAGFIAFWFLLIVIVDLIVFLFKGLVIYFSSVFVASILLGLSPIFIPFILFTLTRKVFDGWMKQLMSYILIPVFYFSSLSIMLTILITLLRQIFNFDYVIDCALRWDPLLFIAAVGWTGIGLAASFIAIFIPPHCIYYWPRIADYYTSYGGLAYQFTQVIALYALTKVVGKVVNLSKVLAASIIGFLPTAAGSVADLGDKVTSGMESAVGLDKASKDRREKATSHAKERRKDVESFMDQRSAVHTNMNTFFDKDKDKDVNTFATNLNQYKEFETDHKEELWQQYKDYSNIKDERNFEDYIQDNNLDKKTSKR